MPMYRVFGVYVALVNCHRVKDFIHEVPPSRVSPTSVFEADSRPPPPPPPPPPKLPGGGPQSQKVPGVDDLAEALGISKGFGLKQLSTALAAMGDEFKKESNNLLKRLSDDFAKANDDLLKKSRGEFDQSSDAGDKPRMLDDDFAKAHADLVTGLQAEFDKSSGNILESIAQKAWKEIEKAGSKYRLASVEGEGGKKDRLMKCLDAMEKAKERNPLLLAAVKEGLSGFAQKTGNPHVNMSMMEVGGDQPLPLSEILDRAGFKPEETLVAFDFDLTVKAPVRDCSCSAAAVGWAPRRGVLSALEELKARGIETIVVTAETPSKNSWSNFDGIYETAQKLKVRDYFGQQFGPGPPVGIPSMQSKTGNYKREHLWVGDYMTDKNRGGIFQAGHGLVLASYEKGPAIEHYIYYFGLRERIKHVIFVDDAVHNVYNVAWHFKMEENDAAFAKDSAHRPAKSALSRIDSIWWSTQELRLDKNCEEGASTCAYEASDGADNSYDPLYSKYRETVRSGTW